MKTLIQGNTARETRQPRKLVLYKPHAGQRELHTSTARFRIATCGRRFGKTYAAVNECARIAWENPGRLVWWVAPVYDLAQIGFRMFSHCFAPIVADVSRAERRAGLSNGSSVLFRSADHWENLVGESLKFLVIDEAARVDVRAWEESLRPTLADQRGRALIIGTPKGKNWFYHLWTKGQDPELKGEYESWQFPTSKNPYIDAREIDQAKSSLPIDTFRQEWEAAFLESNAGVFRNYLACVKPYTIPIAPDRDVEYYAGLDLARLQDFTVLTILDQDKRVVFFDRWNKADWEVQINRIIPIVQRYEARLVVDSTGVGDPIYERLRRAGLDTSPFKFTNETKQRLIEALIMTIERGEIQYPEIKELLHELDIFEYQLGATGTVKYSAPPGYHDDCVISLALANWSVHNAVRTGVRYV